jgi:hypothetical protein
MARPLPIISLCLWAGLAVSCTRPNPAYHGGRGGTSDGPVDAAPQPDSNLPPEDGPPAGTLASDASSSDAMAAVGLLGQYFDDVVLQGLVFKRVDPQIAFDWMTNAPGAGLGNHYGVRWTGSVQAPCAGPFTFFVTAGDGVRLWVDDVAVIDDWRDTPVQERSATVSLGSGDRHRLRLDYYHALNAAAVRLEWSGPCQARQAIPASQLQAPPATACPAPSTGTGSGLKGEYFSDTALSPSVFTRVDPKIDFDFAATPPDSRLPPSNFSARWTGQLEPRQSGLYQFQVVAGDGARLFLDQKAVILDWSVIPSARSRRGTAMLEAGRAYDLRVEYFADAPPNSIRLLWSSDCFDWEVIPAAQLHPTATAPPTCPAPASAGTGTGLAGQYYSDPAFSTPAMSRVDATVNFNWGAGSPGPGLATDHFSVRWQGFLQPRYSDAYTLSFTSDDGVSMWLDGGLVIDRAVDHNIAENGLTVDLQAGRKYAVRIDYHENTGSAVAALSWYSRCQAKESIPTSQLYPQ